MKFKIKETKLNEGRLPYYAVHCISPIKNEIFKAANEKDAEDIVKFLSKFDYVWGNTKNKPKYEVEFQDF